MKNNRLTYTLLVLFFGSLLVYWALEFAGVRTGKERRLRETRLLPGLGDMPESDVRELSIEKGTTKLVFRRRGSGIGQWQMIEPKNVAAEPTRLETLVRNLKDLRRSIDSGNVAGAAAQFGLEPPAATVRLWGAVSSSSSTTGAGNDSPVATLELGKTVRGNRYVRAEPQAGIEVVDSKLLNAIDLPVNDWREQVVMGVPTFQVATLSIQHKGEEIRAERDPRGRWRLTAPLKTPANPAKIESLLSALSSLRVVDGQNGFVADDVKDLAPFGLANPELTVELTTTRPGDAPLVLHVGKPVPDNRDRVYVRQGDQNDVVIVEAKALSEIPANPVPLRSQQVLDFEPATVTQIEIKGLGDPFLLKKAGGAWTITSPVEAKADRISVATFLTRLDGLPTSEFMAPNMAKTAGLDPPTMTILLWEAQGPKTKAQSTPGDPAFVLKIGRHDLLRKTVFAQLEHDESVLAVPDTILDVLPKNSLAFRDLTMLTFNPVEVRKLTLVRAGRTEELEPDTTGGPNRWRLRRPIDGPADAKSVTQILAILSALRADQLVALSAGDGKTYGLDRPTAEIIWETDQTHRLKIGAQVSRSSAYYAQVDDKSFVFTLKTDVLKPLEAELRDHLVLNFSEERAQRLVLNWGWPARSVAFKRHMVATKGQPDWIDEPGSDASGLDQSRIGTVVKAMSALQAIKFVQYDGPIEPSTGLIRPRLTAEVMLSGAEPLRTLRIGYSRPDGHIFAAEGTSGSGPVFLLPSAAWDALIESGERLPPLPANVFAPAR